MNKLCCVSFVLAFAFSWTADASSIRDIRLPANAKPYEKKAASDLKAYLDRIARCRLSVDGSSDVVFHVGDTDFARSKGYVSEWMPDEWWMVKSYGADVILNGGGSRGTLYAVSHFLEDQCGVRWWSPQEEYVPSVDDLELPRIDMSGRPAFRLRDIYRAFNDSNLSIFAVHKRLNGKGGLGSYFGPEYGGAIRYGSPNHCHTFDLYIPNAEYFKEHPEWFSYDAREGRRVSGVFGQLCLTNPELREEMKRRLKGFIEADIRKFKKIGLEPPSLYDISENDNWNYCACTNCVAAKERWNMSGLMLDFVNDIASSVKDQYPHVIVNTFAYHGTELPPKGGKRAADNVMVRLCDTKSNMAAGMFEKGNTGFCEFLADWSKAAKNLSIWDYAVTYTRELTGLPFPSEFHYADYFRECLRRGVYGFFWEHESAHKADMWELKYHLETKLMENPFLDADELIAGFMREYYGKAGEKILAYRKLLDSARRARNGKVTWFPALSDFDWISGGDIASSNILLDDAEKITQGVEPYLSRVKRVRVGLDRLVCLRCRAECRKPTPDVILAGERLKSFWKKWMMRYPKITERKALDEVEAAVGVPPPAHFKGREIYDFTASFITPGTGLEKSVFLVDDPTSEAGRALRINADGSDHFDLPYTIGLYNRGERKTVIKRTFEKPLSEECYAWYFIGEASIPKDSYIWLTGTWRTSLRMSSNTELHGRTFGMYVSAKFTGKKYQKDSEEPSYIWIDRVVLALPEDKEGAKGK